MSTATDASRAMRRSMAMEPSSAPHLAPGTLIGGRYRVLDVIGEGGPRSSSPAWNDHLPGAALLEAGGRVMQRHETSPVSRVREIRMHGLKGGPALSPMTHV
jgi:hypothetical protein